MMRILQSSWFVSLAGCILYLVTTALLITPGQFAGYEPPTREKKFSPSNDPSWRFRNPEFEQWVEELRAERHAMELRGRELEEWAARLQAERQELYMATQVVHQLQMDFDRTILRFQATETQNLKLQTKVVSGMSPEGAAAMLKEMPEPELVRILFTLKPDQASTILDAMSRMGKDEAQLAARATENLRKVLPPDPRTRAGS